MNISKQLAKEGFAYIESSDLDQSFAKSNSLNIEINANLPQDVTVTTIYSPFYFYIQLNENMEEFFDFEESLQSYYTNENIDLVALKRPRLGQMCKKSELSHFTVIH